MSVWLVLGGARSGKTARALSLARHYSPRTYIATGEARDEEMRSRIARHRADRGPGFLTVEEPLDIVTALKAAGVPAELHVFERGRHGIGLAGDVPGADAWPSLCKSWLKGHQIID